MKTNLSFLFQIYLLLNAGVIIAFTLLLPNHAIGATCSAGDFHWLKQQTLEVKDANDVATRLAKIRSNNSGVNEVELIEVTARDGAVAHIAKVEVVRNDQTEVVLDQTNDTFSQALKKLEVFKQFSKRAFKDYAQIMTNNVREISNTKIQITRNNEILFTVEVMQAGGILFTLYENAYGSFNSINWRNVQWTQTAQDLFKSAEEIRNKEAEYRHEDGNLSFVNQYTSPGHILLALAIKPNEGFSNFSDLFSSNSNLASQATGLQRFKEVTLGLFFNSFSAQTRRLNEAEKTLYEIIQEIRPENQKNGIEKNEYPSNVQRPGFFEIEQQQLAEKSITPKERTISNTTNLNEKVETDYALTKGVKEKIQELITAISHKGIIEIFGEPSSGRRTTVGILTDLINAANDSNHPYHREALELIPENLRDLSIHRLEESIYAETSLRGTDTEKFKQLEADLSSFGGKAILFTSDLNLLLRNTNTDSNQSSTSASNLIGTLREPLRDEKFILIFITNRTQQAQITREDTFLSRQTINMPTLTQKEILEYIKPLADKKNTIDRQQLFTPEQLTTLINRTVYIAQRYPALTGEGITGAKRILNAVFDNTKPEDLRNVRNANDLHYHTDRIASQEFANGVMDIGTYFQTQLEPLKIKEDIEKSFIPPNPNILDTFISRMIHTTSRTAPQVEILLGPPGTGKTTFAESLGLAFNREIVVIEGSKLDTETIIGDGPNSIVSKIRAAKGPIIIYINEANLVVSSYFQTNSPITHLERLLEKGEIIDVHGNKVYAQTHTFLLDMNLSDSNVGTFTNWKEEKPDATTRDINRQISRANQR